MKKVPRFGNAFMDRFWNRPLDAVPRVYGSSNINSLATQTESAVLFGGIVPPDVNGFRIANLFIGSSTPSGGAKVRIYVGADRGSGPTTNIPQFYEHDGFCGTAAVPFPVAWLIEPAMPWAFTLYNSKAGGGAALALLWGGLDGWYF